MGEGHASLKLSKEDKSPLHKHWTNNLECPGKERNHWCINKLTLESSAKKTTVVDKN